MFQNKKLEQEVKELKEQITRLERSQADFLMQAHKIMQSVFNNDKRKFMYEVRQEEVELQKDGEKYRAIRKIID